MTPSVTDIRPTLASAASRTGVEPLLERLVPDDLPPKIAVARLFGLVRSLLQENVQLQDELRRVLAASPSGERIAPIATLERERHHGSPPEAA